MRATQAKPRLKILLKANSVSAKSTRNIADAIQQGLLTPTTKQRLEELESQKSELEIKLLQNELQQTILTEEQIIFWISKFKDGDIDDKQYQQSIIDIFVNAIYLYDDRIVFIYNYKSESRTISLNDIEFSDLPKCAPPLGPNANPKPIVFGEVFAFTFYLGRHPIRDTKAAVAPLFCGSNGGFCLAMAVGALQQCRPSSTLPSSMFVFVSRQFSTNCILCCSSK